MKKWRYIIARPNKKVKIDEEDFERVNKHSWRVTLTTTGRERVVTAYREDGKVKTITLGRFLIKVKKGQQVYPRRFQESLDYRKDNLVACTLQERQRLLPKNRKDATSKYRGVSFIRSHDLWRAGIMVDGKSINLGNFKSEDAAALAYNKAARKHFGYIAYQNNVSQRKKPRLGE
jgi:AP2-like factor (euAP2 lineage)